MEKIKKIISVFIKKPVESINEDSVIDKTVVQGSILIHRMYAEIADAGYSITNYNNIHTYRELLTKLELTGTDNQETKVISNNNDEETNNNGFLVGIDIEEISNFKQSNDYREDNFYKQNFSEREISYCLLQPNILQSFAGKFAAKEAIVKADNKYKNRSFNKIEILNNEFGKPEFQDFLISISHTPQNTIAVALRNITPIKEIERNEEAGNIINLQNHSFSKKFIYIAILLSFIAIAVSVASLFYKF